MFACWSDELEWCQKNLSVTPKPLDGATISEVTHIFIIGIVTFIINFVTLFIAFVIILILNFLNGFKPFYNPKTP